MWFEEIYKEFQAKLAFKGVLEHSADIVHNGYFSQDKKTGVWKDTTDRGGEGGSSKDDEQAYELIMKDKERLLDANTPLRFIFSHSALREGWDNPNVFQICTLNETRSEMKKRQEIGRGLRLPVNQDGERVFDQNINILTVIANESYESFARSLQTEIEDECGVSFTGRIKNAKERKSVLLKKGYELDPNFKDLWERIKQKTKYNVNYQTEELIKESAKVLKEVQIKKPKILSIRVKIDINEKGVTTSGGVATAQNIENNYELSLIPDVLSGIQTKTKLTKTTILEILKAGGKMADILVNPQQLMDEGNRVINEALKEMMVDGIKYEKIADSYYEMREFENKELLGYLDNLVEVKDQSKTLYDHIIIDSETIERPFARDLEAREDVKFYFKLPRWFKIETPIGSYNPDWAIVFENDKRVYFVAETKPEGEIRGSEEMKIKCGRKHFNALGNVFFGRVQKVENIIL